MSTWRIVYPHPVWAVVGEPVPATVLVIPSRAILTVNAVSGCSCSAITFPIAIKWLFF
jgi:hypothetical protein